MRRKLDEAGSADHRKASVSTASGGKPLRVDVKNLIDSGLIAAPTPIFGFYYGERIRARLDGDGTFSFRRRKYSSPSMAAGQAITANTGASPPGRLYHSVNGWTFWRITRPDGETRTLAEIREQLPLTSGKRSRN
jgi:hypothetical protein